MVTKRCCLLVRYQENRQGYFASPKGATGQVHTLSVLQTVYIFHDCFLLPDTLSIMPNDDKHVRTSGARYSWSSSSEACTVKLDHTRSLIQYCLTFKISLIEKCLSAGLQNVY